MTQRSFYHFQIINLPKSRSLCQWCHRRILSRECLQGAQSQVWGGCGLADSWNRSWLPMQSATIPCRFESASHGSLFLPNEYGAKPGISWFRLQGSPTAGKKPFLHIAVPRMVVRYLPRRKKISNSCRFLNSKPMGMKMRTCAHIAAQMDLFLFLLDSKCSIF